MTLLLESIQDDRKVLVTLAVLAKHSLHGHGIPWRPNWSSHTSIASDHGHTVLFLGVIPAISKILGKRNMSINPDSKAWVLYPRKLQYPKIKIKTFIFGLQSGKGNSGIERNA